MGGGGTCPLSVGNSERFRKFQDKISIIEIKFHLFGDAGCVIDFSPTFSNESFMI